jgi:hypothetical protein
MSDDEFDRSSGNNSDDGSPSRRAYGSGKRRKSKSKPVPAAKRTHSHARTNSSEVHAKPSEYFSKHMNHVHKIETFTQLHSSHSPQDGIIDPQLVDTKPEDVVEQSSSAPEPIITPLQLNNMLSKSNIKNIRRVASDRKIRFSETKSDTDQEAARYVNKLIKILNSLFITFKYLYAIF